MRVLATCAPPVTIWEIDKAPQGGGYSSVIQKKVPSKEGIMEQFSLEAAVKVAVLLVALGSFACPETEYHLEQYHEGADEPWQAFDTFGNICSDHLCEGDPGCGGTWDAFRLVVGEPERRDRFAFFHGGELCDYGLMEGCTSAAPTVDGEALFGEPGQVFRTDGFYAMYEGMGEVRGQLLDYIFPPPESAWWTMPVGHVRHYVRGACSYGETISGTGLQDLLGHAICDSIMGDPRVEWCLIDASDLSVYLGSYNCDVVTSANRDYFHAQYTFTVQPQHRTGWDCETVEFDLDFWWRFTTGPRDEYLYCPNNQCSERYLECTTDEDCDTHVPGATCNARLSRCSIDPFLDVVDYGVRYWTESSVGGGGAPVCRAIISGFFDSLGELEENSYRDVYSVMLSIIADRMWETPGYLPCGEDSHCQELVDLAWAGAEIATRCDDEQCSFRPHFVQGVNVYPNELELVLARSEEYPSNALYRLLQGADLCTHEDSLRKTVNDYEWVEHWAHD